MADPQPDIPQHLREKAIDLLRAGLALNSDPGVRALAMVFDPPADVVDRCALALMKMESRNG